MIQRRFDLKAEPSVSTEETVEKPPEVLPPSAPPPPIPREASDLELRARQIRWVRERLRIEAAAESQDASQGSK